MTAYAADGSDDPDHVYLRINAAGELADTDTFDDPTDYFDVIRDTNNQLSRNAGHRH
jgi:hypothetical protein